MPINPEGGLDPDDSLRALEQTAVDPRLSQSITLYATELRASEVVAREDDRGFSLQQISGMRELAVRHPELSGEGMLGFNHFLDQQERLALTRGQVSTQSLEPNPVPKSLEPVSFSQRIARPSELSRWVSKQQWLPVRSGIANVMEDIKLSVMAPVVLARGIRKQFGSQTSKITALFIVGLPVELGVLGATMPVILQTGEIQPGVGVLTTALSYMSFGYSLYYSARKNIAPYRQELNKP